MPVKPRPATDRFWSKVVKSDSCWQWTAGKVGGGYGLFSVQCDLSGKRMQVAHRFAWEELNGPVPDGLVLNHLCRNTGCVRPDHLEAVTQGQNVRYSDVTLGIRSARTHCPKGHEYTPDNLVASKRGWRKCKTCHRENAATKRRS